MGLVGTLERIKSKADRFNFLKYKINKRTVKENIIKLVTLSNPDIPATILNAMSVACGWLWYFNNTLLYLQKQLGKLEDNFDVWFDERVLLQEGKSEKEKERKARVQYKTGYLEQKARLRQVNYLCGQLKAVVKSLDKFSDLLQSMKGLVQRESSLDTYNKKSL